MNPVTKSFVISSPIALHLSSVLLHWLGARLDPQGMLDDFPRYAQHVRGFPREDVLVRAEEVDKHVFLFGREGGVDMHHLAVIAARVDEDLLGLLGWLKRSRSFLGVRRLFIDHLVDGWETHGGDDC
jgi:hypothetical protein